MPNRVYSRQQDSRLRLLLSGIVLAVACIEPRGQASGEAETDMAWQKDLPLVGPDARLEADVSPDSPPPATGPCDDGSPRCCDGGAAPPCNGCPAGTIVPEGFVCVPSGTFTMGSNEDEPGHQGGELQHEVTLTRAFFIGATEVTLEGYDPFDNMGTAVLDCGLTCPASFLSFFHAAMYSNARSVAEGLPGCYVNEAGQLYSLDDYDRWETVNPVWVEGPGCLGYRLPTDAEWEYAARAGTTTATYGGPVGELREEGQTGCAYDPLLDPIAWYCGNFVGDGRQPGHEVGQKRPNAWGLFDVFGNVSEWTWGVWDGRRPSSPDAVVDPWERSLDVVQGMTFTTRGCSSGCSSLQMRAAAIGERTGYSRYADVGFRLARTVGPSDVQADSQ